MSSAYHSQGPDIGVSASSRGNGLSIATIVFSVLGLIGWALSIGFMLGWEYKSTDFCQYGGGLKIANAWYVSLPANFGMVYVTARIIFLITSRNFPSPALLVDLNQCVARMVAFTVLNLTTWAMSLSWLVKDDCQKNLVFHLCNYGFVFGSLVAGLAGGVWSAGSNVVATQSRQGVAAAAAAATPKYAAPPPPQTHYNQAYVHHHNQYR